MKSLLKPLLVVVAFWWVVLLLFANYADMVHADGFGWYVARVLLAVLSGVLLVTAWKLMFPERFPPLHIGEKKERAFVRMGNLPSFPVFGNVPGNIKGTTIPETIVEWLRYCQKYSTANAKKIRKALQRVQSEIQVPADLRQWWNEYKSLHPAYALAMQEAWQVMVFSIDPVPASPYGTGHGGATLVEHSWNALRTLLALEKWPVYKGTFNSKGELVVGMMDKSRKEYAFDRNDPMVPLCVFAHDIGKAVCAVRYWQKWDPELNYSNHDTRGKEVLRTLPSWRALQWDDFQRALICIGYYHHPLELPLVKWVDDRTRALLHLVREVDILTGRKESQGEYRQFIANPEDDIKPVKASAPVSPQTADATRQEDDLMYDKPSRLEQGSTRSAQEPTEAIQEQLDGVPERRRNPRPSGRGGRQEPAAELQSDLRQSGPEDLPAEVPPVQAEAATAHSAEGSDETLNALLSAAPEHSSPSEGWGEGLASPSSAAAEEPQDLSDAELEAMRPSVVTNNQTETVAQDVGREVPFNQDFIDAVSIVLVKPNAINGPRSPNKVGFKYGSWLYLNQSLLADRVRDYLKSIPKSRIDVRLCEPPSNGELAPFVAMLLDMLSSKGALKQDWENNWFSARDALFYLENRLSKKNQQSAENNSDRYFICRAYAFGSTIFNIDDVPYEPKISGPCFKERAINDAGEIARLKSIADSWSEPKSKLDVKSEQKEDNEKRLQEKGVKRAPFALGLLFALSDEERAEAIAKDENGVNCYRADVILRRFDKPEVPYEEVEINGQVYWRFNTRPRGARRGVR